MVAGYGNAFGMRVLAWSHNLDDERAAAAGATRVDKDELLQQSDVVSIHLKLSARTRGLIGAAELALMKPSAILVNTSRGPIVDEAALVAALERRQIAPPASTCSTRSRCRPITCCAGSTTRSSRRISAM